MRTSAFWLDAAERAVRTFAQALVAVLVAGFVFTDAAAWGEALLASARFTELTRRHAAYRAQARLLAAAGYDLAAFYDDNAAEDRR